MTQFKVIVPKLNKRAFPVTDTFLKNNIIDVVSQDDIIEGSVSTTNQLGPWIKDIEGHYYWGGGLDLADKPLQIVPVPFDSTKMSWGHRVDDLPTVWMKTKGAGVTVAVIDTGVEKINSDLVNRIDNRSYTLCNNNRELYNDSDGHGTMMAAMIAADGRNAVYGVAPESKVLAVQANVSKYGNDVHLFTKAFDDLAEMHDVEIISCSQIFKEDDPLLRAAVQKCVTAGKIIVAAIGNARDAGNPPAGDTNTYPACYPGVVAVGSYNEAGNISKYMRWNHSTAWIAPGEGVLTSGSGDIPRVINGSSVATAYSAGVIALLISWCRSGSKPVNAVIPALMQYSHHLPAGSPGVEFTGSGKLNVTETLKNL